MEFLKISSHFCKLVFRISVEAHECGEYVLSALFITHFGKGVGVGEGEEVKPHVALNLGKV